MRFGNLDININVSLNPDENATRYVFLAKETPAALDTDNASVCIHPVIGAEGAGAARRGGAGRMETPARYCNTARFYGKPGGVVESWLEGRAGVRGAKLKMSIKSIKSEAQGRLPWNILRQRGNSFSYAISISCFASSPRPSLLLLLLSFSVLASPRPQPPTSDLYAFHPLKPLTPPDIKGNAN